MGHLVPIEAFMFSTLAGIAALAACPILSGHWFELAAGTVAILAFCVAAAALAVSIYP